MERIEDILTGLVKEAILELYHIEVEDGQVQLQKTRKEFEGDLTLVVFPLLRFSKQNPEQTANTIGQWLVQRSAHFASFNVVKGFLNIAVNQQYWIAFFDHCMKLPGYGTKKAQNGSPVIMVEYSSPNTNKPLHLGHIRNNLLGYSVSELLKANGNKVVKTNIVNDRGIHICKSMLAWQKFGNGATPQSTGKKGDHLVGDYYVRFDQEYKSQVSQLINEGMDKDAAGKNAPIIKEAQEMLRKWEAGDPEVLELWQTMNQWVYDGFEVTYKTLGVDFDKIYYESNTYKLGKENVMDGLKKGVFYKKDDGSVWCDLSNEGLNHKLLLRADGTSVYMTQDIGTAKERHDDFRFEKHFYVVGNEQDYHFKVLPLILKKLGYNWANGLCHLSYGMVELPEGKMKSREGTVVDADDLIEEMVQTARNMSNELGKLEGYTEDEQNRVYRILALGALKYFILKVDPKKNMVFNPRESIDFNGNTGPFVQYTYARVQSVKRKAADCEIATFTADMSALVMTEKEKELVKLVYAFPETVAIAANELSPSLIANYCYDLAKEYNQFYHDHPIIKEDNETLRNFRLLLSDKIGQVIETGMALLGIEVPERM
jgi:arginyl-tRNA synthetase